MRRSIHILLILFIPLMSFGQNDTINKIDNNGLMQGYWIYYGVDKPQLKYPDSSTVEEGQYINGKRNGLWKKFNPDGSLRLKASFSNGRLLTSENILCKSSKFDSIIVRLSHANMIGPITDTTKTYYPNNIENLSYIDSLFKLDKSHQASPNIICSHSIEIKLTKFSSTSLCQLRFNTCISDDKASDIARECAKLIFNFD